MKMWPSSVLITIWTAAVIYVQPVATQAATNVSCSASTVWMANTYRQNPCLVSAYLSSVCNKRVWYVPTLESTGVSYLPPLGSSITICRCNTVLYSLLQACAYCQGAVVGTWSAWIFNCPTDYVSKSFPSPVPAGTGIPPWAMLDPTTTDIWNATQAQAYAATESETQPEIAVPAKKRLNIGGIVGGTVGGLIGLFLLLIAVHRWVVRKQARVSAPPTRTAPSKSVLKPTLSISPSAESSGPDQVPADADLKRSAHYASSDYLSPVTLDTGYPSPVALPMKTQSNNPASPSQKGMMDDTHSPHHLTIPPTSSPVAAAPHDNHHRISPLPSPRGETPIEPPLPIASPRRRQFR